MRGLRDIKSYYTVAGTLSSKENQIFTGGDVIVCLKSKGVSFLFKNTFLRLESKVLHQFFSALMWKYLLPAIMFSI